MPIDPASPSVRPRCVRCLRPQVACICRWITPAAHDTEVLILQHPLEVDNPKGSARLLHLSLSRSRLLTGELFEPALLNAPWDAAVPNRDPRTLMLLYPHDAGSAPMPAPSIPLAAAGIRLVVLDGTWRKSRKMLHLNPALQTLPRLSLEGLTSNYLIRRAPAAHQLSTLEAVCAALWELEHDPQICRPLLAAFDGFVAQQMRWQNAGSHERRQNLYKKGL